MRLIISDAQCNLLALSLLRQKPSMLSVKDEVAGIRKRLREFCYQDVSQIHQAITAQLQAEIATLNEANQTHLEKIAELERENQNLQDLLSREESAMSNQQKRKHVQISLEDEDVVAHKLPRTEAELPQVLSQPDALIQTAVDELEDDIQDKHANTFLRQLYSLQLLLGQKRVTSTDLATALVQLAYTMITLVDNVQSTEGTVGILQTRQKTVKVLFRLLERTYRYLLQGLNKLAEREQEVDLKNQVVHSFVQVFIKLTELIGSMSAYEVPMSPSSVTTKPARRSQRQSEGPARARKLEDGDIMPLSRLYITMLANLDPEKSIHLEITEGVLCVLLTRVGNLVKMFVFSEEGDLFGSSSGTTGNIKSKGKSRVEDVTVTASEARYLVWILERAMHLQIKSETLSRRPQVQPASKEGLGIARLDPESLSYQTRSKLQNTMLNAVFPEDTGSFEDRFRENTDPGLLLDEPLAAAPESDVKNWFKQEVWRILSWDVLRRIIELEE
ncbi:MAG: hypothetical protein MMC33_002888 [Icmadophila ericetorum]|nr:hypothetical protein [Icmadophila ericetorum]